MPRTHWFASNRHFVLPLTLGLIVLADFLFYGYPLGWDAGLFLAILAAAVALRSPQLWKRAVGKIALVLSALVLLALVEQPSPLAVLMALFTLGTLALIARGGWTSQFSEWLIRWLHLFITIPFQTLRDARIASRFLKNRPAKRPRSLRFALLWFVPLLAGSIFLLLFAVANPIIAQWLSDLWFKLRHVFDWLPQFLAPARILLWLLTGIAVYGLLRHRPRSHRKTNHINMPPIICPRSATAHHFTIRCLIVFNLVFALQSSLDILYLFGGTKLPPGMTYIQYAHRGAYPLVATAILAAIFVLAAFRTNGPAHRSRLARQLVYLWIAQNIFLMFSTLFRTWLYIQATLLTELRVAVFIWIFLLALGFVTILLKIRARRSNAWLCSINAFTLYAVLYLCAFINFPGLIADFNVRHCREITGNAQPLDLAYLHHLGPPALPALAWIEPRLPQKLQPAAQAAQNDLTATLTQSLSNWRTWTLRRHRIAAQNSTPLPEVRSTTFRF